jgi:hypothetical protein
VGNDVVEEETHCCVGGVVEGRHGFGPFGKLIYFHDDVLVSIARWRIASHEFYAPFVEGADGDDGM